MSNISVWKNLENWAKTIDYSESELIIDAVQKQSERTVELGRRLTDLERPNRFE